MQVRTSAVLTLLALFTAGLTGLTAQPLTSQGTDPLTGTWEVSLYAMAHPTPATFEFVVEGEKVTGSIHSEHTGPGQVTQGTWVNGKLSFVAVFEKHDSIAITGTLENGKLAGEFRTEGFVAKWEATKRPPAKSPGA